MFSANVMGKKYFMGVPRINKEFDLLYFLGITWEVSIRNKLLQEQRSTWLFSYNNLRGNVRVGVNHLIVGTFNAKDVILKVTSLLCKLQQHSIIIECPVKVGHNCV